MENEDSNFYLSAKKIWGTVIKSQPNETFELNQQLELHKSLLSIFNVGAYYYMVFNVYLTELEYISPEIKTVLGYEAEEINAMFFLDRIHPEDKPWFLCFENKLTDFFQALPLEKRGSYKFQHDYRIRTKNNKYVRLLHQILPIEFDENNYYRSLVLHTDISHIKPDGTPSFSIIGLDGEPSFYNMQNNEILMKSFDLFTKRERQILKLIVEGKSSKEIADALFVSLHTVNAHRKNILNKAEVKTPVDLVKKVINEGWI